MSHTNANYATRKRKAPSTWTHFLCKYAPVPMVLLILLFCYGMAMQYVQNHMPTAAKIDNFISAPVATTPTVAPSQQSYSHEIEISSPTSGAAAAQQFVFDQVRNTLLQHPLTTLTAAQRRNFTLADYYEYIHQQPICEGLPVFTSMANVFSELYWQLIENFVYTMVKFELSSCALMICVSDVNCMQRCEAAHFPCIDFQYGMYHPDVALPHALEQIAELKLYHIPRALERGVNIIMLDLDVGFLSSPRNLLDSIKPRFDVYVQKDIAYVMNRTVAGWRTWYTAPLPNIGIMYVKANDKTVRMFQMAWEEYQTTSPKVRKNPGKDQNKVAAAMRSVPGLRWSYFPAGSALLLDMMYKFNDPRYELGGTAAYDLFTVGNDTVGGSEGRAQRLRARKGKRHIMSSRTLDVGTSNGDVYAVHTTCYEQKAKVLGLKAANAFWNPYYYTATRRTLTKPLVYITAQQLRNEVRSLIYLGYATNRSVILPNVLGNEERLVDMDTYLDRVLWPSFRTVFQRAPFVPPPGRHNVILLEPAYYWRIMRDYFDGVQAQKSIPLPTVIPVLRYMRTSMGSGKGSTKSSDVSIPQLEALLQSEEYQDTPRLVLGVLDGRRFRPSEGESVEVAYVEHLQQWAEDSVGGYGSYEDELRYYAELPPLQDVRGRVQHPLYAEWLIGSTRLCENMFKFDRGNRSCFDKCD